MPVKAVSEVVDFQYYGNIFPIQQGVLRYLTHLHIIHHRENIVDFGEMMAITDFLQNQKRKEKKAELKCALLAYQKSQPFLDQ